MCLNDIGIAGAMARERLSRRRGRLRAAFVVALSALVLVLAACGSDNEDPTGSETTPAAVTSGPTGQGAGGTATSEEEPEPSEGGEPEPIDPENPVASLTPEQQIDYAIKGVLASGAPDLACNQVVTEDFVERTFSSRKGCEQATVPASAASFVEVTAVKIDGSEATAKAKPNGGPSDGETITVRLVRENDVWKVDSLKSNVPVGP